MRVDRIQSVEGNHTRGGFTLKQAVLTQKETIEFSEIDVPKITDDEVLVKVKNIGICGSDIHAYYGQHPFMSFPIRLGHEASGEVVEIGKNVHGLKKGDLVKFNQSVWKCVNGNGIDFDNIQIPGVVAWKKLDTYEWHANLQYEVYDVVRYDGRFFMLLETADPATMDKSINPYESDDWGMIGDYVEDYEYEVSDHEYVVFDNEVYYPVMQVNGETPEVHTNIVRDDPRNVNLVKHMTRLAIYELHKLISPTNISNVRSNDYNDSIQWLRDAQKFRLDPQIPRRIDDKENYPYTGWAVEDFNRELNPWKQTWYV